MEKNTKFCNGGAAFRGRGRGFIKERAIGINHNSNSYNSQESSWETPQNEDCLRDSWANYEDYESNGYNEENSKENFGGSWSVNENDYKREEYCNEQNYGVQNNDRCNDVYNRVEDLGDTNDSAWNNVESNYNNENQAGEGDESNDEGKELPKKVEFYIPPELGNEESEVFSSGITTGINFEKFDDIKVEMNGDNLPNVISSFEDVNLRPILMNNIRKSNYTKPTPIQRYALSTVMAERDLMACAQTGSGKTAAFLLPIINNILENPTYLIVDAEHVEPHAIIVSPTRELAIQIYQEARKFSFDTGIKVSLIYCRETIGK